MASSASENVKKSGVVAVWRAAVNLIISKPRVLIPFAVLALAEIIELFVLANSPHFPINKIMAAPIRRLWGEAFLHYPYIYELLPRLFYYAKMAAGIFIGGVTTAMACLITFHAAEGKAAVLKSAFKKSMGRYVSLFLLMLILYVGVHYAMKQPQLLVMLAFRGKTKLLFMGPRLWFEVVLPVFLFLTAIVLQGLFVYSIPYIVIKGNKFLPALGRGILFFFKNARRTIVLVGVPMVLYTPVTILRSNMDVLVSKFGPEAIVPMLVVSVLAATLVVDALVTVATTLYFIEATDA